MLHISLLLFLVVNSYSLIMAHEGPKHVGGKSQTGFTPQYSTFVSLVTIIVLWIFTCIFSECCNTEALRAIVNKQGMPYPFSKQRDGLVECIRSLSEFVHLDAETLF
jgi:hypothetical protein